MNALTDYQIDSVAAAAYTVPTGQPGADGRPPGHCVTAVLVQVRIRNGVTGIGLTYGHEQLTTLVNGLLAGEVTGRDVRDVAGAWSVMNQAMRNLGRPELCSMAIAAVDIALWDAKARCLGEPLHRVLGATRQEVPVYASGGGPGQLDDWVIAGMPRVKITIGGAHGEPDPFGTAALRQVTAARRSLGGDTELYVAANGSYDVTTAAELGRALAEDLDVTLFEEPVSAEDLTGLATLRTKLPLDVAAGERGHHLEYFAALLAAGAVSVVQADVTRCAGITEWLRVAALAEAAKVPLSAQRAPSWHAHVATVPSTLRHVEYFADHARLERVLFDGVLEPRHGTLRPTDAPGLGLTLKVHDAEPYRVA